MQKFRNHVLAVTPPKIVRFTPRKDKIVPQWSLYCLLKFEELTQERENAEIVFRL